jgi:outer membrane lipoprotein-sorting protein
MPNRFFAALLLFALAAGAAAAEVTVDDVLDQAISEPETGYSGRAITIRWFGDRTHSYEYGVSFMPPGRYRREYLGHDGAVASVTVSDGSKEWIYLPRKGKLLSADAVKSFEKVLKPDEEERLLRENYALALTTAAKVSGREAWTLTLTPKRAGKCRQTFTVDRRTGAVLATRRYLPEGRLAALFRFTQFESGPQPEGRFVPPPGLSSATARQGAPDFMSLADLERALGEPARFPAELPGGFVFESADFFDVGAQRVKHARYTDGLSVVSIFQTNKPVRIPPETASEGPVSRSSLRLSAPGHVLRVKAGGRHFTFIGDVSAALLKEIASSVR